MPFISEAQSRRKKQGTDSLSYYSAELGRLSRANRDSFHKSEPYVAATAGYKRHLRHSKDYSSFTLFFDVFGSDYSQLNNMLAADGFPAMNETGGRIGFGTSHKVNRGIVDISYIVVGLSNKSEKGNEKISTSFSNVFQFDLGYDLLNGKIASLYPYAGLALRISTLIFGVRSRRAASRWSRLVALASVVLKRSSTVSRTTTGRLGGSPRSIL